MKPEILKNFIVFEGLDGAGTSTQSKLISEKLENSYLTFEPTDSEIGKLIRKSLRKKVEFNQKTLSYLFSADRSNHLYGKNGIVKKCKNQLVISDRYLFSSLAYQSLDIEFEKIFELNMYFPFPEVVFFLDTSFEECKRRMDDRGKEKEIFEEDEIQKRVYKNYIKTFEKYKEMGYEIIYLNGNLSIEELFEKEISVLKDKKII